MADDVLCAVMNRPNRFLLWLARLPLVLVVIGFSLHPISAQPTRNIILFIGDGRKLESLLEFSKERGENRAHPHRLSDLTHGTPAVQIIDVDSDLS
jgi:hypothetical protein